MAHNDRPGNVGERYVRISPQTVVLAVGIVLLSTILLLFLYTIRFVLIVLLLAIIFAQVIEPPAALLQSRRVPRHVAVISIYLVMLAAVVLAGVLIVPPMILQTRQLIDNVPELIERLQLLLTDSQTTVGIPTDVVTAALGMLGQVVLESRQLLPQLLIVPLQITWVIIAATSILVISFYWLLVSDELGHWLILAVPPRHRGVARAITSDMGAKVGNWVRGQVILSLSIGIMTYLGLVILQVDFPVILAMWAAITELVPMVGPVIGAVPAVIIALLTSPLQAVLVVLMYFIVQQLEANLLVPNVMHRQVGLHPLVVIVSLLIGGTLQGVVGAVLAVPVAAALQVVVMHLLKYLQAVEGKE